MCNSFLLSVAQARTHTHTQAHSHTHSLRQQAHIRRHKNKFIDWYRLRRASSELPSCSPAAGACCVLPLPAASEQKNRQNNNGYTHIHTCTHAQQLMPDDWHFTKDTRPRVAKRAKRNKCDAFYLLQLCNRPALPLDPLPLPSPSLQPAAGTVTVTVGLNVSCSCCRLAPPTISVSVAIVGGIAIVCAPMANNLN